jgi:hypothetical protein
VEVDNLKCCSVGLQARALIVLAPCSDNGVPGLMVSWPPNYPYCYMYYLKHTFLLLYAGFICYSCRKVVMRICFVNLKMLLCSEICSSLMVKN